jgi:hypothetical protein
VGSNGAHFLAALGLTIALLPGCAHHDADPVPPNIADRPFPPSNKWCAAAEQAKNEPNIDPDLCRRYVDAATVNGCYGPPPPKPSPIYQKAGATNEEFQRTKARCLCKAGVEQISIHSLSRSACVPRVWFSSKNENDLGR